MRTRVLKYMGGKHHLAPWIMGYIEKIPHKVYCEPFCGGASVFFRKNPSQVEVLNDTYYLLYNFYKVLQDPVLVEEFQRRVEFVPYSLEEFKDFIEVVRERGETFTVPDVEMAVAFFVLSNQGFAGHMPHTLFPGDWGRSRFRGHPRDFARKKELLREYHKRLLGVYVDCVDGIRCIDRWDSEDTLFYVDPPYVLTTRKRKKVYVQELDEEYHRRLVERLTQTKGGCIVSTYETPLYEEPLVRAGFLKVERRVVAHSIGITEKYQVPTRGERKECLYVRGVERV